MYKMISMRHNNAYIHSLVKFMLGCRIAKVSKKHVGHFGHLFHIGYISEAIFGLTFRCHIEVSLKDQTAAISATRDLVA